MRRWRFALISALLGVHLTGLAQTEEPNWEGLARTHRNDLAYRLEDGMIDGMDVHDALDCFLKARSLPAEESEKAVGLYLKGMAALRKPLKPLPQAKWPTNPTGIKLQFKEKLDVPERVSKGLGLPHRKDVEFRIVAFKVDELQEYGVVVSPGRPGKFPLLVYVHGAAYGVPDYTLPWMAQLADAGYVVAAPSFRGEDLLLDGMGGVIKAPPYKCEGKIENLVGEVNDVLAIADGALKLDNVRGDRFAIIGHSFGSGAGLLAAARSKKVACVVSYDAWMTNPFRFYWERLQAENSLRNKSFLWGSWPEFTGQPTKDQLAGLMQRSIVHHADQVNAPMLLFVGGGYNGSAYHYSHKQLAQQLKRHKKTVRFEIIPAGGHNFVLYYKEEPAKIALRIQTEWLNKYFPPTKASTAK